MKHKHIDELARHFVYERTSKQPNPRMQQIIYRLTGDLMKIIEDLELTDDEVWSGLDFLEKAGKNDEIKLISAGLGIDRFLDIRLEEAEARFGLGGGTPRSIEGPLYVHGAPVSRFFARLDEVGEDQGQVFFMQGQVTDVTGYPIGGAVVEVWQADSKGAYSHFDESQPPYNLRRTIICDQTGAYQFRSLMPAGYGVPEGGQTQQLMDQLGRHGQRPPHLHFFIHAEGFRKLTTQINLPGSPYTYDDYAFSDRPGLVPHMALIEDPVELQKKELDKPFFSIDYNFRLTPALHGAPPSDIERSRAQDFKDPKKGRQDAASYYFQKLPEDEPVQGE